MVGRGGAAVFHSRRGAGLVVIKRLLTIDSGGGWRVGHGRLAFRVGGERRVGMAGRGHVGDAIEVRMLLVIASRLASGDERCNHNGGERQS